MRFKKNKQNISAEIMKRFVKRETLFSVNCILAVFMVVFYKAFFTEQNHFLF